MLKRTIIALPTEFTNSQPSSNSTQPMQLRKRCYVRCKTQVRNYQTPEGVRNMQHYDLLMLPAGGKKQTSLKTLTSLNTAHCTGRSN